MVGRTKVIYDDTAPSRSCKHQPWSRCCHPVLSPRAPLAMSLPRSLSTPGVLTQLSGGGKVLRRPNR